MTGKQRWLGFKNFASLIFILVVGLFLLCCWLGYALDCGGMGVMTKVTIYLDDETLRRMRKTAEKERLVLSYRVELRLEDSYVNQWPKNYFETCGSLSDVEEFRIPADGSFGGDRTQPLL